MPATYKSVVVMHLSGGRIVTVHRLQKGLLKEYDDNDVSGVCVMRSQSQGNKLVEALMALDGVVMAEVVDMGGRGWRAEK